MAYPDHGSRWHKLGGMAAWAASVAVFGLFVVTGLEAPVQADASSVNPSVPGQWVALERTSPAAVPGRILVKRKPGVSDDRLQQAIGAQGGRTVGRIAQIDVHEIQVPDHAVARVIAALERNPAIEFAHPDYLEELLSIIPDDPRYGSAWHLPNIEAPTAWTMSKGDGIVVAILDTGIDSSHPDFAGKLVQGWNAASQSDDTSDVHGHGTRVAGTVGAATNNGTGVAAVGWNAEIMPIRVTDRSDGVASSSDMARGLTWAADNGAHVANMS